MPEERKSWDDYFMDLAELASTRATCDRARVGCVLVQGKDVIASGYNGSLPKADHCDDVGHFMQEGHCQRTVHSEINSIASAAKRGVSTNGAIAYCTHLPCIVCMKALISAGIKSIYYSKEYRPEDLPDFIREKIILVKMNRENNGNKKVQ